MSDNSGALVADAGRRRKRDCAADAVLKGRLVPKTDSGPSRRAVHLYTVRCPASAVSRTTFAVLQRSRVANAGRLGPWRSGFPGNGRNDWGVRFQGKKRSLVTLSQV